MGIIFRILYEFSSHIVDMVNSPDRNDFILFEKSIVELKKAVEKQFFPSFSCEEIDETLKSIDNIMKPFSFPTNLLENRRIYL